MAATLLKGRKPFASWKPRQFHLAEFVDQKTSAVIDELLVVTFLGPHSFTGQDCAEFHCHGGPYVVRKILENLYEHGFRAADPGEFTRRAFLNGKLDLTAAEGIRELVESASEQQWIAARQLMSGHLRNEVVNLRQQLIEAMAYLEAQIDFPDEGDTASVELTDVDRRVTTVHKSLEHLASTYQSGRVASQGLMVAMFGLPNVGKSTLLNTLLGKDRAIVSDIAGTTRDYLEERCLINGRLLRLVDMAGVRENAEEIEKIGVERSLQIAREADVVLLLASAESNADELAQSCNWLEKNAAGEVVKVLTKSDIGNPSWSSGLLAISCKTGDGIDLLKSELAKRVDRFTGHLSEANAFLSTARQSDAVARALVALVAFENARKTRAFEECLAFELQQAARALTSVVGDISNDDILDAVFSQFCIGK